MVEAIATRLEPERFGVEALYVTGSTAPTYQNFSAESSDDLRRIAAATVSPYGTSLFRALANHKRLG